MLDSGLPLTFIEYEGIFKKTAIYPNAGENYYYPILGLCGEAGEIAEKLKKIHRDKNDIMTEYDRQELVKELGDVLWYLNALAIEFGTTLEAVAETNYKKLISRLERNTLQGSGDNR